MSAEEQEKWQEEAEEEVRRAVERFEVKLGPDPLEMFDHAYSERPPYLEKQRRELAELLQVRGSWSETEPGERAESEGSGDGAGDDETGSPGQETEGGPESAGKEAA